MAYRSQRVLVGVHGLDDLSVDELGSDVVQLDVVPRTEDLLAVVQLPRRVFLAAALRPHQLLTLGHRVLHVVWTLAQRRHIHKAV